MSYLDCKTLLQLFHSSGLWEERNKNRAKHCNMLINSNSIIMTDSGEPLQFLPFIRAYCAFRSSFLHLPRRLVRFWGVSAHQSTCGKVFEDFFLPNCYLIISPFCYRFHRRLPPGVVHPRQSQKNALLLMARFAKQAKSFCIWPFGSQITASQICRRFFVHEPNRLASRWDVATFATGRARRGYWVTPAWDEWRWRNATVRYIFLRVSRLITNIDHRLHGVVDCCWQRWCVCFCQDRFLQALRIQSNGV